ncbi:NPC intracellular cholesterol transporter 2 homolog a-like [Uloborus diversus]|uniref:NPC intracellular cholesterol transporter 2 homolog a-like n=1 Tax=Uloborus diversus TaxID=327109 RepID=UPI002409C2BB|nr:NPC intracellular cholesterol transporter 2 homolog a-like [Uloborus diversus]
MSVRSFAYFTTMNRMLLCIAFSLLVAVGNCSPFNDCGSKTGTPTSVKVTDCPDDADECVLKRGTTAGIEVDFTAGAATKTLKTSVHGIIANVPMPFPLPEPDACKTGVTCPVTKGSTYIYKNNLAIRQIYPALEVTVRWELKDDSGADMVCVEIPCRLE